MPIHVVPAEGLPSRAPGWRRKKPAWWRPSPQGRVSSHLACLRWCGYVISYRDGKNVYYTLAEPRVRDLLELAQRILTDNAERIIACQVIR